jgi:molybdopterin-guanine dinucleotide biosynthesis protein A
LRRGAAVPELLAAIVLAGGSGSRLGGVDKAALEVSGRSLLDRALATAGDRPTVVVGPPRPLPPGVLRACEEPPGGGPAAGAAAGFTALERWLAGSTPDGEIPREALVLVLAVDHPGVTPETVARLVSSFSQDGIRGAVLVHQGRRQYGVGVYSAWALRRSISRRASWHGAALRELLGALADHEVPASESEADDIDTPEDLRRWRTGIADRY